MTRSLVGAVAAASEEQAFTAAAFAPRISGAARFMLVVSTALPVGDIGLRDAAMAIVQYPVAR
jgi:hypothetical protein